MFSTGGCRGIPTAVFLRPTKVFFEFEMENYDFQKSVTPRRRCERLSKLRVMRFGKRKYIRRAQESRQYMWRPWAAKTVKMIYISGQ